MTHRTRTILAASIAIASIGTLAGCGLLGPARDADGRVTDTTTIRASTLLVGDCFSFLDDADLSEVSVTPCSPDHTHVVIGTGELTATQIDSGGGLQNVVSASCAEDFDAFKSAAAEGVKPEQEFIVSTTDRDGETITLYACVATDAAAA